jgi:hypothetical protein
LLTWVLTALEWEFFFKPTFEHFEDSKVFYTVIGGFAIAWLALWELIKRFKELNKDD